MSGILDAASVPQSRESWGRRCNLVRGLSGNIKVEILKRAFRSSKVEMKMNR